MIDTAASRTLGLVSLGIAATEMAAPDKLERMMGISNGENTGILRVLAIRELMHGIDLLMHPDRPAPGILARVAGDMLDGMLLASAIAKAKRPAGLAVIAAVVLPVVVADMISAATLAMNSGGSLRK